MTHSVPPITPAMLVKIEAAARREAIQSLQPSRHETWAMLVVVVGLVLVGVMR